MADLGVWVLGRAPASVINPSEIQTTSFSQGSAGPFLTNVAERFANVELAKEFMDLTAKTMNTCRTYTTNGSTIHLGPATFPKLGDETFAVRASGSSPYGAIDGTVVYVRVGPRVASIQTLSFGPTQVSQNLVAFLTRMVELRL